MPTPEALLVGAQRDPDANAHPRIAGIGTQLPAQVVSNAEIAAQAGVDEQWILKRTGIRSRRRAGPDVDLLDLATAAAQNALTDAEQAASEIDLVIFAT